MLFLRYFSVVGVTLTLFGCSPQPFDAGAEGDKLLQRDSEWAENAAAGRDIDKTVSYWSEDATIVPQGQPIVHGRARSEERRVGKECRSRWARYHGKKK